MIGRTTRIITGGIAVVVVAAFVLGLSHSISSGFAGFFGGLPFAVITVFVLILIGYDYWEACVRKQNKDDDPPTHR